MSDVIIYAIGFLAQGFFSARILTQWIMSERARRVLSPTLFWVLSIIGSYLLCIYGWLREDFAIVLGQVISYYVYLWNLNAKGAWRPLNIFIKILLLFTPPVAMIFASGSSQEFISQFFQNESVPIWLLLFGSAGQVIFTLRFLYQWYISRKAGHSELPAGFWWLSLVGSLTIVSYGILRRDPVLIIGQSFGLVAYIRNLMIGMRQKKQMEIS